MTVEEMWTKFVELGIATDEELKLVSAINGYSEETLLDVLYARTGLRSIDQLEEELY